MPLKRCAVLFALLLPHGSDALAHKECGHIDTDVAMTGGFLLTRAISLATNLAFANSTLVKIPSFDQALGELESATVTLKVAVDFEGVCGPYGLVYDQPEFEACTSPDTCPEYPLESKCAWWAEDSAFPSSDCSEAASNGGDAFPCTSIGCSSATTRCRVGVEKALGPNAVFLNGHRLGKIHPSGGSPKKGWHDCVELCERNCDTLAADIASGEDDSDDGDNPVSSLALNFSALQEMFGSYKEVKLCGTDLTQPEGIPSDGSPFAYSWSGREYAFTEGKGGDDDEGKRPILDLLKNDTDVQLLEWRVKTAAEDDDSDYVPTPGFAPLRTNFYGPVQDIRASFHGEYCIEYFYQP